MYIKFVMSYDNQEQLHSEKIIPAKSGFAVYKNIAKDIKDVEHILEHGKSDFLGWSKLKEYFDEFPNCEHEYYSVAIKGDSESLVIFSAMPIFITNLEGKTIDRYIPKGMPVNKLSGE